MLHAISRIPTNNTPSTYQPNNKPLLFEPLSTTREKSSRLKSPLAGGFTEKPTPAQNRAVVCMQSLTPRYIGYPYAPVRLWRGCCYLVSSFVSMHVFSLVLVSRRVSLSIYIHALCPSLRLLFLSPFSLSSSSSFLSVRVQSEFESNSLR